MSSDHIFVVYSDDLLFHIGRDPASEPYNKACRTIAATTIAKVELPHPLIREVAALSPSVRSMQSQ